MHCFPEHFQKLTRRAAGLYPAAPSSSCPGSWNDTRDGMSQDTISSSSTQTCSVDRNDEFSCKQTKTTSFSCQVRTSGLGLQTNCTSGLNVEESFGSNRTEQGWCEGDLRLKEPPSWIHRSSFERTEAACAPLFTPRSACHTTGGVSRFHDSRVRTAIASADKQGETRVHNGGMTTMRLVPGTFYIVCLDHSEQAKEKFGSEVRMSPENDAKWEMSRVKTASERWM